MSTRGDAAGVQSCNTARANQPRGTRPAALSLLTAIMVAVVTTSASAQGVYMPSVGPINQSIGGAAVAAPIDSAGALYWNPATISGLQSSEVEFGLGLVLPSTTVSSSVAPNSFGVGVPPIPLAGSTRSEPGVSPVPTIALVHKVRDSYWTVGIGIFGVGGFSTNYPASLTNPILSPQPPNGFGLGRVSSRGEIFQIAPTISYAITENWSVGIAPTITMAHVEADPGFLSPPNDANGNGFFTYGSGTGTRYIFGGGFQIGTYYITDYDWRVGVSYKSPQWLEPVRVNSQDELGRPTFSKVHFDLPSIASLGVAYTGFERWVLPFDIRFFDYAATDGFRQRGYNPNGSVAGLGWKSVLSITQGAQYEMTDNLTWRAGYTFNQNPITGPQTIFNIPTSLIIQHWLSTGFTYRLTPQVAATVAYTHGFENQMTGPFVLPAGPIPGTSITGRVSADILNFGLSVNY